MVRLVRFFGLVHNEYIKILKKISTKVMIAIVLLTAVGLSFIMMLMNRTGMSESDFYYDMSNYAEDYQDQIDWYEQTKPEGYEKQVGIYKFMLNNKIGYDDWRQDLITDIMNMDNISDDDINTALAALKDSDWKDYCKVMLKNAATDGDKWEYAYRLEKDIGYTEEFDKQSEIIRTVNAAKTSLSYSDAGDSAEKTAATNEILIGTYQLENGVYDNTAEMSSLENLDPSKKFGFWNVYMMTPYLVTVIGMVMIVIAGGSVASEFNQGTIKFLLINPVKRWKILMSKYFSVISLGYILLVLLFLICIPIVGLIIGFDGISTPYLTVENGNIVSINSFAVAARSYLISSIEMVVMATLAFAVSSLIRSSALAIGLSVFLMFAGETITTILAQLGQDWARYLIFANTDLLSISQGSSMFPQHSLTFAIGVIIAYMTVFILTAWDGFTKRSV